MPIMESLEKSVTEGFDRIVIAVPALEAAIADYEALLGQPAARQSSHRAWFLLANTTLELQEQEVAESVIDGLVLRGAQWGIEDEAVMNLLGLSLSTCDGSRTAQAKSSMTTVPALSVDHLVLRTDNAEACIETFAQSLGVRLALDKTVPEWGGRMLFFRAGKMTLEVIESDQDDRSGNYFWGIAFQHATLADLCEALTLRGVEHSDSREGRKPGTLVATVKSHCLSLPTLLIQPAPK